MFDFTTSNYHLHELSNAEFWLICKCFILIRANIYFQYFIEIIFHRTFLYVDNKYLKARSYEVHTISFQTFFVMGI